MNEKIIRNKNKDIVTVIRHIVRMILICNIIKYSIISNRDKQGRGVANQPFSLQLLKEAGTFSIVLPLGEHWFFQSWLLFEIKTNIENMVCKT